MYSKAGMVMPRFGKLRPRAGRRPSAMELGPGTGSLVPPVSAP